MRYMRHRWPVPRLRRVRAVPDPGPVRLTRRQGYPGHWGPGRADHHAHSHRRAGESDQRRRKAWTGDPRPGRPDPAVAPQHPAPVVEGRKAPRRLVHPGPAPAYVPDPAALLEGCPTSRHHQRRPHHAELGMVLPAAVAIQVFHTRHLGRDVTQGGAAVVTLLIGAHPLGKAVLDGRRPGDQGRAVAATGRQLHPLPRGQIEGLVHGLHLECAAPGGGPGGVILAVHTEGPGAVGLQARFGRQHLQLGGDLTRAHAHRQAAAVELKAHPRLIHAQDLHLGAGAQAQLGGTHPDFRLRTALRRQAVAFGECPVAQSLGPLALLGVEQPHAALKVRQPARPLWHRWGCCVWRRVWRRRACRGIRRPGSPRRPCMGRRTWDGQGKRGAQPHQPDSQPCPPALEWLKPVCDHGAPSSGTRR